MIFSLWGSGMCSVGSGGRCATFHPRFTWRISTTLCSPMLRRGRHGRTRRSQEGRPKSSSNSSRIRRGREREGRGRTATDSVGGKRG